MEVPKNLQISVSEVVLRLNGKIIHDEYYNPPKTMTAIPVRKTKVYPVGGFGDVPSEQEYNELLKSSRKKEKEDNKSDWIYILKTI